MIWLIIKNNCANLIGKPYAMYSLLFEVSSSGYNSNKYNETQSIMCRQRLARPFPGLSFAYQIPNVIGQVSRYLLNLKNNDYWQNFDKSGLNI